jgi:hypothetical protein
VLNRTELEALIAATRAPAEGAAPDPQVRVPAAGQKEALEALGRGIAPEGPSTHVAKWNKHEDLVVEVAISGLSGYGSYRYREDLHVFFTGDVLQIASGYGRAEHGPLGGLPHLRRVVAGIRERLHTRLKREQKREKLKKLKERAIATHVEALAARMGLSYALENMHNKVKLIVKLDERNGLFLDIPHGRFQQAIDEMPPIIEAVQEIYARGVRFTIGSTVHVGSFRSPPGRA